MFASKSRLAAVAVVSVAVVLAGCGGPSTRKAEIDPRLGVSPSPRVVEKGQPVPEGGGRAVTGKPYVIAGRLYVPDSDPRGYTEVGLASWYGDDFHGRYTANREIYDMDRLSAAHTTLPLPSYVRVTSLATGRSVVVRVNDRGPYHSNRIMDLSGGAARLLGVARLGVSKVRLEYVGRAPLEGNDMAYLRSTYRGPGAPEETGGTLAGNIPLIGPVLGKVASLVPGVSSATAPAPAAEPVQTADLIATPPPGAVLPPERPYGIIPAESVHVASVDPFDAYTFGTANRLAALQPAKPVVPTAVAPAAIVPTAYTNMPDGVVFPQPRPDYFGTIRSGARMSQNRLSTPVDAAAAFPSAALGYAEGRSARHYDGVTDSDLNR